MKLLILLSLFLIGCTGIFEDVGNAIDGIIPDDAKETFIKNGGNHIDLINVTPGVINTQTVTLGRNAAGALTFPIVCNSGQQVTAVFDRVHPDRDFWYSQIITLNYDPGALECGRKYRALAYSENGVYTDLTAVLIPTYGVTVRITFTDIGVL
jgi:hypothetical protein